MRIKVTTTLRGDLWEALQIECIKRKCDANDILESSSPSISREPRKAVSDGMREETPGEVGCRLA